MGGRRQAGALQFLFFSRFRAGVRNQALANFDPNSDSNCITHAHTNANSSFITQAKVAKVDRNSNSFTRVNSSSYAATPIPDLTDTLEGDLIIRLHVQASSWFKPPTDGLAGCLVKMDFVGQK
jgi:hypothetical protein